MKKYPFITFVKKKTGFKGFGFYEGERFQFCFMSAVLCVKVCECEMLNAVRNLLTIDSELWGSTAAEWFGK